MDVKLNDDQKAACLQRVVDKYKELGMEVPEDLCGGIRPDKFDGLLAKHLTYLSKERGVHSL